MLLSKLRRSFPRKAIQAIATSLTLSLTTPLSQGSPKVTIEDFGAPPGAADNTSIPRKINDLGQVLGDYSAPGVGGTAFLWLPEPAYGLEAGFHSPFDFIPNAISNTGLFAGIHEGAAIANVDGIISQTYFSGNPFDQSTIQDINDSGHYVGTYRGIDEDGGYSGLVGVVQRESRDVLFSPLNEHRNVGLVAINANGNAAGNYTNSWGGVLRGFFWNGQPTLLDGEGVDEYKHTHAQDINDRDEIVGSINLNNPENFIWLPQPAYGLGTGLHVIFSNNAFQGGPTHINNRGQVLNARMLWDQGETYLLEDLMPENETRRVELVHDLNNNGTAIVRFDDSSYGLMTIGPVELKLTVDPEKPGYGVDEDLELSIRLTHPGGGPVTYEFENGLLMQEPEPEEGAEPVISYEEPELPDPFTLSEEDPQRIFTIPAKTGKPGVARLITQIKATPANLDPYELEAEVTLLVDPLQVTLRALPLIDDEPIVNMELLEGEEEGQFIVTDEEGNVIEPKVEVTVTNLSDASIKALLQGVDPRARDKSAVVGRINTLGEFPIEFKLNDEDLEGIIGPGESRTREIDLNIFEDGRFEFVATVTGFYVDTPEATFASVQRGAPIAVGEPYPVELVIDFVRTPVITNQNNGAFFVQPGGSIEIIASVNNLTSNSTLEFYGILAKKELNAQSAHLTSEHGRAYNPDLPFVHDHVVDANASVVLGGTVRTSADGGPRGTVEWQPLEDAKLIDDATQEETELTEDDILIKSTAGGWLGDELTMRVIQDHSRPEAPASLTGLQQVAIYSHGAMIGMGEWTYDTFDAIGGIGRLAGSISADPSLLADAWGEASRAVWEAAQLVGETWSEMTPQEKEEFVLSVTGEVQRRLLLLATARAPVTAEDYNAVLNWTRDATYVLFGGVTDAYASDDPAQIADMWGQVSGHVAMEVITAAISELKFTKYVKGSEINKFTANKALGPALNNQEAALRAIKSGPLADSTVLAAFGPGSEDLRAFEKVFEAFKVKGYARERSPLAYSLINQRKVAVWKPEIMKPKGISDIDLILLGKNHPVLPGADGNPVNLQGITAIFVPEPDDVLLPRLVAEGHSPELIETCLARAAKRRKEFQKYYPEFVDWTENGIPVPRNFKDNGIPDPQGQGNPTREMRFETLIRNPDDGPSILIPKIANEAGELRYISGDIDWVHFSFLDGTPLDPKTAARLYTVLMDCCGLQHPETVTWINKGRAFFESKADQIAEYVRGEKALLEVSGQGPRAVRVSQNLTRFATNTNARNHLVFFENGLKSRLYATAADVETAFAKLKPQGSSAVVMPFLWTAKSDDPLADTTLNGDDWAFTNADLAEHMLRQGDGGKIERFDGTGWSVWDGVTSPSGNANENRLRTQSEHRIALAPISVTEAEAKAGDSLLPIQDLPGKWGEWIAGHVEHWFDVGDRIVIAPGELTQEVRFILNVEPLLLDRPLQYDHPIETLVAVVPASMTVAEMGNAASALLATVEEDGLTTLVWSTLPGHRYSLEKENPPGQWEAIQENLDTEDTVMAVTLPTADYDPEGRYRLYNAGLSPKPLKITSLVFDPNAGILELSWTRQPANAYLVEVSSTLEPESWGTILPEFFPVGADALTLLPMYPAESPKRFYRIRSNDTSATASEETIVAMEYDEQFQTIEITWSTVANEDYVLEFASYDAPDDWSQFGDAITAVSTRSSLVVPSGLQKYEKIYRVRKLDQLSPPQQFIINI